MLGDFNNTHNTPSTKAVIGRGNTALVETPPAEDTYARIDYLMLCQAMARHWVTNETYIPMIPNWGIGSDNRPLVAEFETNNR